MEAVEKQPVPKIEDIHYWQHHINCYEKSGLTKAEYCRKNGVNSPRFIYWSRKLRLTSNELIAVKVQDTFLSSSNETLCTLVLKNQNLEIKIHNTDILSFILDKYK